MSDKNIYKLYAFRHYEASDDGSWVERHVDESNDLKWANTLLCVLKEASIVKYQ